ncbi:MAG: DUF1512 domain-containing protein [Nitrososphaerota archaeon]|nr:DUF1512 domain-containing protein [Nitrososphaerota archaeon]
MVTLTPSSGDNMGIMFQLLWFLFLLTFFFIYPYFGQRTQLAFVLRYIEKRLAILKQVRDEVRDRTISTIKTYIEGGKDSSSIEKELDNLMEFFYIAPESMDPSGIVYKLEHILEIGDSRFEESVARMAPRADVHRVKTLTNLVEVARALNLIYRVVRHYYLLGRRTANYFLALQIQIQLPMIMELAESYRQASYAFLKGLPIGDGIGVLSAARFVRESKKISETEIAKDTWLDVVEFEGRKVFVVRPIGPGGTVGRPGEAVRKLVYEMDTNPDLIITIDAALKLEGEETGKIAEGVGVAIGGPGIDKFKIETLAKEKGVPLYAIVIYQSIIEAITPMRENILKSADTVVNRVKELIRDKVPSNGTAIVAGIGNTIGVGL